MTGKINLLGIVDPTWYGVKRALTAICDEISDPEDAVNKMHELRPKIIVLGCYKKEWKNILIEAKKLKIKVICAWYASFILNEFDHINRVWMAEMIASYKEGLIDIIATPHKGLSETFTKLGIETQYLPCVLKPDVLPKVAKLKGLNIGILGSGQAWKNMECQIVAASLVKDARIHIQFLKHWDVIKALGLSDRIAVHPHIESDGEYYELVGGMTVNMAVSLSEVFSYLTVESVLMGTPVVTGDITPIFRGSHLPKMLSVCRTPYFEDPVAIYKNLLATLDNYKRIQREGRLYVLDFIKRENKIAHSVVKSWG